MAADQQRALQALCLLKFWITFYSRPAFYLSVPQWRFYRHNLQFGGANLVSLEYCRSIDSAVFKVLSPELLEAFKGFLSVARN